MVRSPTISNSELNSTRAVVRRTEEEEEALQDAGDDIQVIEVNSSSDSEESSETELGETQ
jgi:hypothetical protein